MIAMNDDAVKSTKAADSVRAVERALDILLAFGDRAHPMSASELMTLTTLSRPTLYRLLHTLEGKGFVDSEGEPQKFKLGSALPKLVNAWGLSEDIARRAHGTMQLLWEVSGETVALLIHQNMHRVCVAEMESSNPLSFKRGVGYRERVFIGASGRAILAFLDDIDSYINDLDPASAIKLKEELAQIRVNRYALSKDELIQGAVAIAAPLFGVGNKVIGSLAIYGPSVRLTSRRTLDLSTLLVEQSLHLSVVLGAKFSG